MSSSSSGSRWMEVEARTVTPQPGRRSKRSGRASARTKTGELRDQVSRCSMKSSNPWSAHCRSQKTRRTVAVPAIRSKKVRHAAKRTSRDSCGSSSSPSRPVRRGSIHLRSVASGTICSRIWAKRVLAVSRSSDSVIPARPRTISASAQ